MNSLLEYVKALTKPVKVCVVEAEEQVCHEIEDALSVYNCNVVLNYNEEDGCACLRDCGHCDADLVFVSSDMQCKCTLVDVVKRIEKDCPQASIVILTRHPGNQANIDIMKRGVYTFLVKNGSFTQEHVRRVFNQANLKLRSRCVGLDQACATA